MAGAPPPFDHQQAELFLQLLGKDPAQTRIRGFFEKHDPRKAGDHGRKASYSRQQVVQWIRQGRGIYVVINDGGDKAEQIAGCRALFNEWDDQPREWQLTAWQSLGMPTPTCQVDTRRQSIHTYWRLQQLIHREQFTGLQRRLVAHGDSDNLIDPSRVMRLPGCPRGDGAREMVRLIWAPPADGNPLLYVVGDLDARLPQLPSPEPAATAPRQQARAEARASTGEPCDVPPRGMDQIREALNCIPRRKSGNGNYGAQLGDRDMLWGLVAAVRDAGGTIENAIDLMEAHSPSAACGWDVQQVARSGKGAKTAATFWAIAKANGFDTRRHDLQRPAPEPPEGTPAQQAPWGQGDTAAEQPAGQPAGQQKAKPQRFTPRADTAAQWGARRMGHSRAMACFDRCVEVQAQRERNSLRRRARLLKATKDLGLAAYINRQEIAQRVLEAKARCSGEGFKPLNAADRAAMPKPVVRWLVKGLIPANDLTILGGRPKVGKTRVAVAIVAAVLRGESFLDFPVAASAPPVLLVTDDQSAGDTADMLTALDLWNHPRLFWSEHFRLTETDLQLLLDAIKANPGALVVLDSLRSIGRALQHGENDPEIGATLYDLKQAVTEAGGTLLLIHHCNKAADLVGVEALSGHNAIGGAANTVVTLHHCPNEKGLPDKTNPQRRLHSEGRSGENCDVVIDRAGRGAYRLVSTFDHWQQQLAEAKKTQKLEQLTSLQERVRDALEDSGEWMTRRQVCDAIGVAWTERGRTGEPRNVLKALHRLVELEAAESAKSGTEATFRASRCAQNEGVPRVPGVPLSDAKGSEWHPPLGATGCQGATPVDGTPWHPPLGATENDCGDWVAPLAPVAPPISDLPLLARAAAPAATTPDLREGDLVELLHADGSWRNGWKVADVLATTIGTRYRLESGSDYRVVGPAEVRLCGAQQQEAA